MNEQTKKILLQLDEVGRYETPSNFDYWLIKSKVTKLVTNLNDKFGVNFLLDDQIQDASFYCDIEVPINLVTKPKPQIGYSIRISNFGLLATISFETKYSQDTVKSFIEILEQNGFVYVNIDELDEAYDGSFIDFYNILGGDNPTWGTRYFDYL